MRHKTPIIAPSLAAGNLLQLGLELEKLEKAKADAIHFDVMDGHFVPLLTLGVPILEAIRKATTLFLDVHIMASNPESTFQHYLDAGADLLTIPVETSQHPHRLVEAIQKTGKKAGIALNPGTHWNAIEYLLPYVDQVTVMSVNPGFSFQQNIPSMVQKVKALNEFREQNKLPFDIQMDGGINSKNLKTYWDAGASHFVAGGAVMGQADFSLAISKLKELS
jgi:ribulose-phosphate 3-epimerase